MVGENLRRPSGPVAGTDPVSRKPAGPSLPLFGYVFGRNIRLYRVISNISRWQVVRTLRAKFTRQVANQPVPSTVPHPTVLTHMAHPGPSMARATNTFAVVYHFTPKSL